ncbi:hypothetical protein Angca_003743 [Angiostrongylus cantonensis]|nr:hypothetical protein Angca_003743 [Angiostrongylus cantonensis]
MVFRTIYSIRDSIINMSSDIITSTDTPLQRSTIIPTVELILGTITYLVIIVMTIVGNTLVAVAIFSYRPLKKVQNYFLVSLAASDLAVAILVMPLHVVKFLADGRWLLGIPICQFFTTADILLCTSSILNLCAIAIDRYCAIHDPINYAQKRTPRFVCLVILTVWILSAIISVPPLIGWNDWSSQKLRDHCELSSERAFVVFSASGSFFLPLLVMVIVYAKIYLEARQRIRTNRGRSALTRIKNAATDEIDDRPESKRFSMDSTKMGRRTSEKIPLVHTVGTSIFTVTFTFDFILVFLLQSFVGMKRYFLYSHSNQSFLLFLKNPTAMLRHREKISVAKEKRAAKTIAVIIFVFTFCWLPFFCAYVILPFCETCTLHPKVNQAFTWLGYINSSLNPFLYGILNLEFRRAFKKILCPKAVLEQRRRRLSAQP